MRNFRVALIALLLFGGLGSLNYVVPALAQSMNQLGFVIPSGGGNLTTVNMQKHMAGGGASPNTCTNCTLDTNSSDIVGGFLTTNTTAGITFATPWQAAPKCFLQPQGTAALLGNATMPTYRVTATNIHADTIANAQRYGYWCVGLGNG